MRTKSATASLLLAHAESDSVHALGEEKLIQKIRIWLGDTNPPAPFGIGDDCAVLARSTHQQVITVDPLIYGRHFDDAVSAKAAGAKLLKRNLSDLAAMGARPTAAVIALALSPRTSTRWLEQFYRGLAEAARKFSVKIVGGDVAQLDQGFVATLTLIGRASKDRILTRKGAKIGDLICVTGKLGGSLLGHHFSFTPRLAEGAWLADRPDVHSLMDVSDGLAKDLRALTPTDAFAAVSSTAIPIAPAARRLAQSSGRSSLVHALTDGEDYELLFTLDGRTDFEKFSAAWKKRFPLLLTRLGAFVAPRKVRDDEIDWKTLSGYEHLR